ncbi:hypothetical protein RJ639_038622, partial [Escallonia herrerae]
MIPAKKAANAVGGKTARACDSCLVKRARWYCAADDAFLCRGCDSSIHSANQLASRHERVRLETASFKAADNHSPAPAWLQGFTRKARTPRHPKSKLVQQKRKDKEKVMHTLALVPEIGNEEGSLDENEEQLLYRVPIFDPFAAQLCNVSNEIESISNHMSSENVLFNSDNGLPEEACDLESIPMFLPSELELAEFAADVESLLGTGLDEDACGIEGLGLVKCKEEENMDVCFEGNRVKVEEDEEVEAASIACHMDQPGFDISRETLDWNFDCESPVTGEGEEEEKAADIAEMEMMNGERKPQVQRKILLRLNHEAVINAWDNQGSPWTTGTRPEFNPDDCWPDFMGMFPAGMHNPYGDVGGHRDSGREARVSRYREKRRTRLFSKKIRYEVRKLNAEKRPRMKGRFVKRTPFAGPAHAFPY